MVVASHMHTGKLAIVFGQRRLSYRYKIGHLTDTVYCRMNENVATGRKVTKSRDVGVRTVTNVK